ncbi:hypothetical protein DFH27DRAFT_522565 [Peziza echinospora]|nr:hypothetical protein DFH27DRAFT_522565 [Peziza echinospora]
MEIHRSFASASINLLVILCSFIMWTCAMNVYDQQGHENLPPPTGILTMDVGPTITSHVAVTLYSHYTVTEPLPAITTTEFSTVIITATSHLPTIIYTPDPSAESGPIDKKTDQKETDWVATIFMGSIQTIVLIVDRLWAYVRRVVKSRADKKKTPQEPTPIMVTCKGTSVDAATEGRRDGARKGDDAAGVGGYPTPMRTAAGESGLREHISSYKVDLA